MRGYGVGVRLVPMLTLGFAVPLTAQDQGILYCLYYESHRFNIFAECSPIDDLYVLADDDIET